MCEKELGQLYRTLHGWVNRWIPDLMADDITATAMVALIRDAMRGHRTQYGPYRHVFECAEKHMRWWGQANRYDIPFGLWRTIPIPDPDHLCELARAYSVIYMGHELGQVSMPEEDLLMEKVLTGRLTYLGQWNMPVRDPQVPTVMAILERVTYALDHHQCGPDDDCREFRAVWEFEDRRGAWWLTEFAPQAREYING